MKALGKGSIASMVGVFLTIAWVVLWALAFALALGAIGYAGLYALIGSGVIDESVLLGGQGQISAGGSSADYDLTFDNPGGATWPVVAPALLIGGVAIGGGIVIVGRLRRLFASFTSGEPFRRENADHLRVIWIAMLVIELSRYLLMGIVAAIFAAAGLPEGASADFDLSIDLSTWMSIAILIVLAEVFREGARLKEEQELTI